MNKLQVLAEQEGYEDVDEFLEEFMFDSTCPGICTNDGCDYNTMVEPDSAEGWCEFCDTNTVTSGLVLGGLC